ncbi:MAG TPA: nuclear transport factor 2 family protein [Rhodanobacter sp.]|nr:nuclear transport factor 2 family protein [Rhodanobacter sp.]
MAATKEIEQLEHAFWKSLVDRDAHAAVAMLPNQSLMVSGRGAMRFDPAQYGKMLQDPGHGLLDYTLSDMEVSFPTGDIAIVTYRAHQTMRMDGKEHTEDVVDSSTWVRMDGAWKCVAHTESAAAKAA